MRRRRSPIASIHSIVLFGVAKLNCCGDWLIIDDADDDDDDQPGVGLNGFGQGAVERMSSSTRRFMYSELSPTRFCAYVIIKPL